MNNKKIIIALFIICSTLLISGCTNSEKNVLLISKELSPSAQEQIIAPENSSITINIPGGLLTEKQTLEISSIKNPEPTFFPGMRSLGAYEITLTKSASDINTSFQKEATLEFAYNDSDIPEGVKPENAFVVAYYDIDSKTWVEVPITVDALNHKVLVNTTHFSPWDLFGLLTDYESVPSSEGHFTVYYDKKADFHCFGSENGGENFCAQGIGKVAEVARKAYLDAGYKVPSKINIYIGDNEESEMSPYTGNILLSKTFETVNSKSKTESIVTADNRVKHEVAHELFHVVQNQYLNIFSMKSRHWFMEASADYAADKIAMHDGTMGMDIRPDYLLSSLYSQTGLHDYSTAHFINYLIEKDSMTFLGMFNYINSHNALDGQDTLILLKDYVDGKGAQIETINNNPKETKFVDAYHGFAAYYLFDTKSPIKIKSDFNGETGSIAVNMQEDEDSKIVSVPMLTPYTTQVIAIKADPGADAARTITVNPQEDLGSSTTMGISLDAYLAVNNDPHTAKYIGSTTTKNQKINADIGKDDTLYLLAVDTLNPAGGSSRPFNIEITSSKNGKKKSISLNIDKKSDLTQNALTIKGTGTVVGPAEMVAIADTSNPNVVYVTISNPKNSDVPIEITGKLKYDVEKNHWVLDSQSDCKITKDVSNFVYKITYNAPEKKVVMSTDGNIDILISQETLAKGEFRADVDLVWDWTDKYECTADSQTPSGTQHAVGGPGTNIIKISIQSSSWGW